MKKWIVTVTVLALTASLLAGCGGKSEENTSETTQSSTESAAVENTNETETAVEYGPEAYLSGINAADYVTLGDYKGLEITVAAAVVTDDEVQSQIDYVLQSNMVTDEITDRAVETGDIANIDYEGKIDGVAFDGGTSQGYDLKIGSGAFIPGFEDGLIGAKTGETVDVKVTFPEDYHGTDVAGKDAVFTVKVNSIKVESLPEFTDEFVQGLEEGYSTTEEYENYIYDMLMQTAQENRNMEAQSIILENVKGNAEFKEPPTEMVTRYYDRIVSNMSYYASMFGYDLDTFLEAQGSTDEDLQASAAEAAKEIIIMQAIAEAEGLAVTEEEVDEELKANALMDGYEDVEEYKALIDYEAYKEYLMTEKVLDFLLENAVITETEADEAETAEGTEAETAETETTGNETEEAETAETESETETTVKTEAEAESE